MAELRDAVETASRFRWRHRSVAVAALVLLGAVAASPGAGARPETGSGWLLKPAQNGLVAYSYAGDIYVGDPDTGATSPIVTHPAYEVNPVFAPGGQRIAFIRGNPQTAQAKVVVVRTGGSDERLIFPRGRRHRGLGNYGWTPNGNSLVVELDRAPFSYPRGDGELSLFDSGGSGEEQVLTPPLPRAIGAHYWGHNQIAPMVRPLSGDGILSGGRNDVRVFDRQLTTATHLNQALKPFEPYHTSNLTWSPDGNQVLFSLGLGTSRSPSPEPRKGGGLYVMSSRGDELRRLGDAGYPGFWQWSPDGSKIAFERVRNNTNRAVLVVLDLESGEERSLSSTSARLKYAGRKEFATITNNNVAHRWAYEGWTWAPDGRSLLVLENHRTRPWVVDIETDTVRKLPWLADSMPSWQRVMRS